MRVRPLDVHTRGVLDLRFSLELLVADQPGGDVRRTAGGLANDEFDRMRGIGLRASDIRRSRNEGGGTRKLEKTEEYIRQVEALRRELAPHLKFLAGQVQKLERADETERLAAFVS